MGKPGTGGEKTGVKDKKTCGRKEHGVESIRCMKLSLRGSVSRTGVGTIGSLVEQSSRKGKWKGIYIK